MSFVNALTVLHQHYHDQYKHCYHREDYVHAASPIIPAFPPKTQASASSINLLPSSPPSLLPSQQCRNSFRTAPTSRQAPSPARLLLPLTASPPFLHPTFQKQDAPLLLLLSSFPCLKTSCLPCS